MQVTNTHNRSIQYTTTQPSHGPSAVESKKTSPKISDLFGAHHQSPPPTSKPLLTREIRHIPPGERYYSYSDDTSGSAPPNNSPTHDSEFSESHLDVFTPLDLEVSLATRLSAPHNRGLEQYFSETKQTIPQVAIRQDKERYLQAIQDESHRIPQTPAASITPQFNPATLLKSAIKKCISLHNIELDKVVTITHLALSETDKQLYRHYYPWLPLNFSAINVSSLDQIHFFLHWSAAAPVRSNDIGLLYVPPLKPSAQSSSNSARENEHHP